tara:strand:- start:1792 stop:1914 length:123 start_codon:yes stop_codon:yes gene_type:complete
MGFIRQLIFATLIPTKVQEAIKIDELMKVNKALEKKKKKK